MDGARVIGHIYTDFGSKFGIPRQSGLIEGLKGKIVMEPEFSTPEAFRGIEEFSHLWILWKFSESKKDGWAATVRPPRLGGKVKKGVFATRSPFRPSDIGLSCVKLERFAVEDCGAVLYVAGVDMVDGTPIYDIKPYIPIADCKPEASEGFTEGTKVQKLEVVFPEHLLEVLPEEKREAAIMMLSQDPRPRYMPEDKHVYAIAFAGYDIRFTIDDDTAKVFEVEILNTHEIIR